MTAHAEASRELGVDRLDRDAACDEADHHVEQQICGLVDDLVIGAARQLGMSGVATVSIYRVS